MSTGLQGVFQVAAAQPVNYVIEEVEDLFELDNMVRISSSSLLTITHKFKHSSLVAFVFGLHSRLASVYQQQQ